MLTSFEDKDIFKIPHGERPIFHGAIPEFEGCNSSQDFWKVMDNGDVVYDGSGWLKDSNGIYKRDENGNRIGAEGVETGFMKIMGIDGEGENGAYTAAQRAEVQLFLSDSGLIRSNHSDPNNIMWDGEGIPNSFNTYGTTIDLTSVNMNKALNMDKLINKWGSTVDTAVFERYVGNEIRSEIADVLHANVNNMFPAEVQDLLGQDDYLVGRYTSEPVAMRALALKNAIIDFTLNTNELFDGNIRISQDYGPASGQYGYSFHSAADVAGDGETFNGMEIYAAQTGIAKLVRDRNPLFYSSLDSFKAARDNETDDFGYYQFHSDLNNPEGEQYWVDQSAIGNSVRIEHGFNFENRFISAGFFSQHNHLTETSAIQGSFLNANSLIGTGGNTGNSDGAHDHFQMFTVKQNNQDNLNNWYLDTLYQMNYNATQYPDTGWSRYYNPDPRIDFLETYY